MGKSKLRYMDGTSVFGDLSGESFSQVQSPTGYVEKMSLKWCENVTCSIPYIKTKCNGCHGGLMRSAYGTGFSSPFVTANDRYSHPSDFPTESVALCMYYLLSTILPPEPLIETLRFLIIFPRSLSHWCFRCG